MTTKAITAAEAGLSRDEQIEIALRAMVSHGGVTSIEQIVHEVEREMNGSVLSDQGKENLRYFLDIVARRNSWIYPEIEKDVFEITRRGRILATQQSYKPKVEQTEVEQAEKKNTKKYQKLASEIKDSKNSYDPRKINVVRKSMTIFQVVRKIKENQIVLRPNFQRRFVWDEIQQSRLIESVLLNIPLPTLYVSAEERGSEDHLIQWLVIDGLQRLTTLDKFINQQTLSLIGLEFLDELEGLKFGELPRGFQTDIEESELSFYVVQPSTPVEVKFTIFSRVNTSGLILEPQEIRYALCQGKSTDLLREMTELDSFINATTGSIDPRRMADQECVLRFLAFHIKGYWRYKDSDLDGFLTRVMEEINQFSDEQLGKLKLSFDDAMRKSQIVFKEYAFRKMDTKDIMYPISKALFEVWSVLLLDYSDEELKKHRKQIVQKFIKLLDDKGFANSIANGISSIKNVQKRFGTVEHLLAEVIK